MIPGHNAGITVELTGGAAGRSDVTVTYELTALTDAATRYLHAFADHYPAMLDQWAEAITAALTEPQA